MVNKTLGKLKLIYSPSRQSRAPLGLLRAVGSYCSNDCKEERIFFDPKQFCKDQSHRDTPTMQWSTPNRLWLR